jgi:hypothetical protein
MLRTTSCSVNSASSASDSFIAIGLMSKAKRAAFESLCHAAAEQAADGDECSVSAVRFFELAKRNRCRPGATFEVVLRVDTTVTDPSDPAEITRSLASALRRACRYCAARLSG